MIKKILIIALLSISSFVEYSIAGPHNNDIYFETQPNTTGLLRGTTNFVVTDFYINPIRDPHGTLNYKHKPFKIIDGNHFTFSLERSSNENAARWFNKRFGGKKNTFGAKASTLNFVIEGTLNLSLRENQVMGIPAGKYKFEEIALAQGSEDNNNMWWFGGTYCFNTSKFLVRCRGISSAGKPVWFDFLKQKIGRSSGQKTVRIISGGSSNIIETNSGDKTKWISSSNKKWMANIKDSTTLSELSIPGTHDTMTYTSNISGAGKIKPEYVRTQVMTLEQQLATGIRFIDIRATPFEYRNLHSRSIDHLKVWHGEYADLNFTVKDVLNKVKEFLANNPSETVYMRLKSEGGKTDDVKFGKLWDKLWNSTIYEGMFWKPVIKSTSEIGSEVLNPTLKSTRGKLVVLQNFTVYCNDIPWNSYKCYQKKPADEAEAVYGPFWNSFDKQDSSDVNEKFTMTSKFDAIKKFMEKTNQEKGTKTAINFLSANGYDVNLSPRRIATIAYGAAFKTAPDQLSSSTLYYGMNALTQAKLETIDYAGIVPMDFPGPGITTKLIDMSIQMNVK
ncbi:phosphatidylinositol-specific phospholipase C domain-containing protein [Endozoicomonas sp. ALE010]|uniref:phosphatidylinositol-specific phospholipase C domain-containing protein n=1 Tax=Endozoicomonas sp. ALE010 TaxID=3403081 RepID=UPI003BB5D9F1